MMTLDEMRRFVTSHTVTVHCVHCRGSRHFGVRVYAPLLVMYPEFNDMTNETEAHVGVDVILESGCRAPVYEPEENAMKMEAHAKMLEIFNQALSPQRPPEDKARASLLPAGKAY